jgi:predicted Zn-dependent protease with MMP-like domain
MSPKHLENVATAVISQTLQRLPEPVRSAAANCMVELESKLDMALLEEGLSEDLLGLFEGYPRDQDHLASSLADLPRIRLFLDNLWEQAGRDRVRFREEVRITLLHELGHYLGLNEDQVSQLGLE